MDYSENFDQVYFQKKLNICSLVNSNFNGEETRVNCSMAFKQKQKIKKREKKVEVLKTMKKVQIQLNEDGHKKYRMIPFRVRSQ